ncbi:MAG: hypothetical protein ACKOEM_01395 [Planctomycetia bacterium]
MNRLTAAPAAISRWMIRMGRKKKFVSMLRFKADAHPETVERKIRRPTTLRKRAPVDEARAWLPRDLDSFVSRGRAFDPPGLRSSRYAQPFARCTMNPSSRASHLRTRRLPSLWIGLAFPADVTTPMNPRFIRPAAG